MNVYKYKTTKGTKYYFKVMIHGKTIFKRGYFSRQEAQKAYLALFDDKENVIHIPTFFEALEAYMSFRKESLKPTTFYSLNLNVEKYIKLLPDIKVDGFFYADFVIWKDKISQIDYKEKNRFINLMKSIFSFINDYYGYNNLSVKKLVPFKNYDSVKIDSKEKYVSLDDFQKFLNVIPAKFYCFFVVSYFTGIRLGEALGLTKKSFKDGQLFIYQTRTNQVGMKKSVVLSPKTKTFVRTYFLADFLIKLLEEYINSLDLKEDDFLFDFGRTTIRRIIINGCEKAKIEPFHFHQLRSTESTLLYNLGIPLEDISKYLGHSSITITSKYYLELLNDNKKRIANILDEKFGKDFKNKDE